MDFFVFCQVANLFCALAINFLKGLHLSILVSLTYFVHFLEIDFSIFCEDQLHEIKF